MEKRPLTSEVDSRLPRRPRGLALETERQDPKVEIISSELSLLASLSMPPPAVSPSSSLTTSARAEGTSNRLSRGTSRGGSTPWLNSSFRMPTEKADLRRLSDEIAASAALLRNI